MGEPKRSRFQRVARGYRTVALLTFTAVLLLLVVNGAIWTVNAVRDWATASDRAQTNPAFDRFGEGAVMAAYPSMARADVNDMLRSTWSRPILYAPFTQLRERVYESRFVNVAKTGFRKGGEQGPWPPISEHFNVFVFGGSTTFGYGVADEDTIPSRLQEHLSSAGGRSVRVYNFGAGFYFSLQERVLFEQLLLEGQRPDAVVFIDGLNEFVYAKGEPHLTRTLSKFVERGHTRPFSRIVQGTATGKFVRWLRDKWREPKSVSPLEPEEARTRVDAAIERYLRNKKLIEIVAGSLSIPTIFVWQPVPTYGFDPSKHPFKGDGFGVHALSATGYERFATAHAKGGAHRNLLWLADTQKDLDFTAYVDLVHYAPRMCEEVAARIARGIRERTLLPE